MAPIDQSVQAGLTVSEYYHKIESRLGYNLLLGGTRHFGFYPAGTWSPFPINGALRAMEEYLFRLLDVPPDALVLDGGAGVCDVAIYMASRGARVHAIDLLNLHVGWGMRNVARRHASDEVQVSQMSFQQLDFNDSTFDGAYTMETLVHATDPDAAMREFFRVLKPGATMVHIEYEHDGCPDSAVRRKLQRVNSGSSMPAFTQFAPYGAIRKRLEAVGFEDVEVNDLSLNVLPMLRLFVVLAFVPYLIIRLLQLQDHFVNTMAAVDMYRIRHHIRFVSIRARKPRSDGRRRQQRTATSDKSDGDLYRRG